MTSTEIIELTNAIIKKYGLEPTKEIRNAIYDAIITVLYSGQEAKK